MAAEATKAEDSEKNAGKNPDLVASKVDFDKTNALSSPAEDLVTDDELDDLEEDIIVTHL